jgi:hypothetical protein
MWKLSNKASADVLIAAHHRRTTDLAEWFSRKDKPGWGTAPRKTFMRDEFASLGFLAVALAGVAMLCSGLLALVLV